MDAHLATLQTATPSRFRDWPNREIPGVATGVYTIWRGDELIYVGMAGRGLTKEKSEAKMAAGKQSGLFDRLRAHASGARNGNQFCIYICDRLVLPTLSAGDIQSVAAGVLSLDHRTREYIHEHLAYRYVVTADDREAFALEEAVKRGALEAGTPLLNPAG